VRANKDKLETPNATRKGGKKKEEGVSAFRFREKEEGRKERETESKGEGGHFRITKGREERKVFLTSAGKGGGREKREKIE